MALAVLRELGQSGYAVTATVNEGLPPLGHACRYVKHRITLPREGYTDALLKLAEGSVLLPTGMQTLRAAAERYDEFSTRFHALLPTNNALSQACDKLAVADIARDCGLLVPQEYQLHMPKFPCVLKYRNGEALGLSAKLRYAIAHTQGEYENAHQAMTQRINNSADGELFCSQYIQGGAYCVSAVLNNKSQPVSVFCHQRIREYPKSGGPSCVAKAIWHPRLINDALKLLKTLKLKGFAMVEFKGSPEEPYLLEVNPRIWGAFPLARICGVGMTTTYINSAMYNSDDQWSPLNKQPQWVGQKMQYFANDFVGHGGKAIFDFISPNCKGGVFDWRDLRGSAAYTFGLFKKGGRKNET